MVIRRVTEIPEGVRTGRQVSVSFFIRGNGAFFSVFDQRHIRLARSPECHSSDILAAFDITLVITERREYPLGPRMLPVVIVAVGRRQNDFNERWASLRRSARFRRGERAFCGHS